jgi:hypothetical protein
MPNNKQTCEKKADIDQKAQKAIDEIDPVLQNPQGKDLQKALKLASDTLKVIKNDPHHL